MPASMQPACILIVEDDPDTAVAIATEVAALGCTSVIATTLPEGMQAATSGPAVIVLDRMLPGGDGVDAIAALRANRSQALILVLSALGRAAQRVERLDKRADDDLAKPFEPGAVRASLRALLRRATMQGADNDMLALGTVVIRLNARTVHVGQTHAPVSPREFDLITLFASNAGHIATPMRFLEQVWNLHFDPGTNVVDVHVGRLRRKLEEVAGHPLFQSTRGEGHVFAPLAPTR